MMNSMEYLTESIKDYKQLSHSETEKLIRKAQAGDIEARNKLIMHNFKLILHALSGLYARYADTSDIVMSGVSGLITAIEKFNFDMNCKFSTYARIWIYQKMSRFAKNNNTMISLPTNIVDDKKIDKSEYYTMSFDDLMNLRSGEKDALLDRVDVGLSVEDKEIDYLLKSSVNKMLNDLPERTARLLRGYFGIDCDQLTLEELGNEYSITRERTRQIIFAELTRLNKSAKINSMFKNIMTKHVNNTTRRPRVANIAHDSSGVDKFGWINTSMYIKLPIYEKFKKISGRHVGYLAECIVIDFINRFQEDNTIIYTYQSIINKGSGFRKVSVHTKSKYTCKKSFRHTYAQKLKEICQENGYFTGYILGALITNFVCSKNEQQRILRKVDIDVKKQ